MSPLWRHFLSHLLDLRNSCCGILGASPTPDICQHKRPSAARASALQSPYLTQTFTMNVPFSACRRAKAICSGHTGTPGILPNGVWWHGRDKSYNALGPDGT